MNNKLNLISLEEFKAGMLRGSETLQHVKDVCERFLSCPLRAIIAPQLNNEASSATVLDIAKAHRKREDHGTSPELDEFSDFSMLFGEESMDLITDDCSALALIAGLASDERFDPAYEPSLEQNTPEYARSIKDFDGSALPFFRLSIDELFAYRELLSTDGKMKSVYDDYFRKDCEEYYKMTGTKATVAYTFDKASDAINAMDHKYINPLFYYNDPVYHPGHPFCYESDDIDYELSTEDKITAYVRVNTIINKGMRLCNRYRHMSLSEIRSLMDNDICADRTDEHTIGKNEKRYMIDGQEYIGDPHADRNS